MKKLFITLLIGIFLLSFASALSDNRILEYYPMEDSSGNLKGIVTGRDFTPATAYQVEGVVDFGVSITGDRPATIRYPYFSPGNNISFGGWVNITSSAVTSGFMGIGNSSNLIYNIDLEGGNWRMTLFDSSTGVTKALDIDGRFHHIVLTYDGTNSILYYDGEQVGQSADAVDISNSNDVRIALAVNPGISSDLPGRVDELFFYNRTLTSSEVIELNNTNSIDNLGYPFSSTYVLLNNPIEEFNISSSSYEFNATITPRNSANLTNATIYLWYNNGSLFKQQTNDLTGNQQNFTSFTLNELVVGKFKWSVLGVSENSTGSVFTGFAYTNRSVNVQAEETFSLFNTPTTETKYEQFILNVSIPSESIINSAKLIWNNTEYSSTIINTSASDYKFTNAFDIPIIGSSTIPVIYNFTFSDGTEQSINLGDQEVRFANLTSCNGGNAVYSNFTFKNETVAKERVRALISSASFNYYLGTGSLNKTFTYSKATENLEYNFCFSPSDESINTTIDLSYDNSYSQQRKFVQNKITLTNSTTNTLLWLLPTLEGIAVTFQVVDAAEEGIEGATLKLSRVGYGDVSTSQTGSSGTTSIFLDPDATYTLTVSKSGFPTFEATQTFPDSSYTISLGSSAVSTPDDYTQGVAYIIKPGLITLTNGTTYNFNFTTTTSFWSFDEFGFRLFNSTGDQLAFTSSGSDSGGIVSVNLDTGNHSEITMNGYWLINGNYTNVTRTWLVLDSGQTDYSILRFFTDLKSYIDSGMFGMSDFGLRLIIFIVIFMTVGALSYAYGLTSPAALVGLVFVMTAFFDYVLDLLPPEGDYAPTIIMAIITALMAISGGFRR